MEAGPRWKRATTAAARVQAAGKTLKGKRMSQSAATYLCGILQQATAKQRRSACPCASWHGAPVAAGGWPCAC